MLFLLENIITFVSSQGLSTSSFPPVISGITPWFGGAEGNLIFWSLQCINLLKSLFKVEQLLRFQEQTFHHLVFGAMFQFILEMMFVYLVDISPLIPK